MCATNMKPTIFQVVENCPAILNIYGGPHIQVRHGFKFKPQTTYNALLVCSEQIWLSTDEDALND